MSRRAYPKIRFEMIIYGNNTDVCLICSLRPVSIMTSMKFREKLFYAWMSICWLFISVYLSHYIHLICAVFFFLSLIFQRNDEVFSHCGRLNHAVSPTLSSPRTLRLNLMDIVSNATTLYL